MPASPGFLAPKWEKRLYKVLVQKLDLNLVAQAAEDFEEARLIAATFEAIQGAVPRGDHERASQLLGWVVGAGYDPSVDPFVTKYLPHSFINLEVAEGVTAHLPLDRDALGLLYAEILQQRGEVSAAIDVVEGLTPSTIAAVSLVELYAFQSKWDEVVELTNGVTNEDEASTYLLIQRAVALRELSFYEAARESLKEALRVRSRPIDLRNRAYAERAIAYLREGKKGLARKDFERVLAQDANYPGIREELERLA
ncbi:lipopolysaccharide assembly protein LapB [Homoserinimonas sp. OAct 916]|uniref:tetratricopeptide repeat protein n=1 Tax=Homoserinimonas sp. OAct 916 TaxID=2211450 RepID=UPI001E5AC4FF|nr:hypothetical protein [Homoserinimonas sp. OAct 916]